MGLLTAPQESGVPASTPCTAVANGRCTLAEEYGMITA
jgi:hypothetical protein